MARPPRYVPALPLPRRPYRLGGGASRARLQAAETGPRAAPRREWSEPAELDAAQVQRFRYGVDLFNAGCWWEAHEVWEAIWGRARRGSPLACLLQGLIFAAAAQLQAEAGRPRGWARLSARAAERLRQARRHDPHGRPLGLALDVLLDALPSPGGERPSPPLRLWLHEVPLSTH